MAHLGTLRDFQFDGDVRDIRGATLYGEDDEKLGKIDDVIFDHGSGAIRYAVVDSGGWLTSHKYLVPANRIMPYHRNENDFYADLDKERIKMFPKYDEKALESEERWNDYEKDYRTRWDESPVLHEEGSTRVITPPPEQVPSTGAGQSVATGTGAPREISASELYPQRMGTEDRLMTNPSTNQAQAPITEEPERSREIESATWGTGRLNPRFTEFQEQISKRRQDVTKGCNVCGRKAA